jgi:hypothetical protein
MSLALCALGLGLAPAAKAYTPVTVTGFNADVIADGTATSASAASTTIGVDEGNYVFMAQSFNPNGTSYLPNNGLITSAVATTSGLTYQLAPYTGNNSLRMPATSPGTGVGTGTVTLTTPQAAGEIYLLTTSGSGASTVTITVTFTDGTTQVFAAQTVADWYGGAGFARQGLGRVQRAVDNRENNATDPRLYQKLLTVATGNINKLIQSISFNKTSTTGVLNIFAVTLNPVCSGTPAGGTPTASVANACSSTAINLALPGASPEIGITYQWQRSPASANTFTNLGTAQTTPGYTGATQTAATDYRVIITCAGSGISTTSGIVSVGQNTFVNCYCTPTGGNCANEWIRGVTLNTLANTGTACTTGGYVDYTANAAFTTTLTPNASYALTVDVRVNAASSQAGVWIDYNHSGTFEASEFTLVGTGPATGFAQLNTSLTTNITVPLSALTGVTRMRVRSNNGALTSAQACLNNGVGEVEDYLVTIATPVACSGTPVAGAAQASATAVCPNTPFTLSVSGLTPGVSGLTYQWESSPASAGTYTAIAGATTAVYTVASQTAATDYRVQVTCTAGPATAASTPVTVNRGAFSDCYCVPTYASGGANDIIRSVTLGTLVNNTAAAGNVAPYYHSYSAQQPGTLTIPTITTGTTANVVVTFGSETVQYSALWIDFDHSGAFEASEYFSLNTSAGSGGTATIPVAVPTTALAGLTKLRVRGGDDATIAATQACGATQSDYGEAEDYTVEVLLAAATRNAQSDIAINAFPNPATSVLTVQVAAAPATNATAQLTDLTGRVLQTAAVTGQKASFNMSNLAAGIYLVRYSDASHAKTIKVSKQ